MPSSARTSPSTVTLIANYVPLQSPAGGPNFYEFGEDVLYEIHIDTNGNAEPDITYQFRFTTEVGDPDTFLYNTGLITSLSSPAWNRKQFYSVTRVDRRGVHHLGRNLACPPCNIGPLSTPNYAAALAQPAVHTLSDGSCVFAGQRAEGFYVDLGSIFDLLNLRPIQELNVFAKALGLTSAAGVNSTKFLNVHSIALQVPISEDHRARPAGHRRLDDGQQAARRHPRRFRRRARPERPAHAGVAAGQPADQRGHHPDGQEGLLEHPAAGPRQAVRSVTSPTPSWPG